MDGLSSHYYEHQFSDNDISFYQTIGREHNIHYEVPVSTVSRSNITPRSTSKETPPPEYSNFGTNASPAPSRESYAPLSLPRAGSGLQFAHSSGKTAKNNDWQGSRHSAAQAYEVPAPSDRGPTDHTTQKPYDRVS